MIMETKKTLLYIDDEYINLQLFSLNLRKKYNIITAESGIKGLEILRNNSEINVVISDLKMPNMNGLEFIQQAKVDFPDLKYFITSGFDSNQEILDALKDGLILKFFHKPYNVSEIESGIEGF